MLYNFAQIPSATEYCAFDKTLNGDIEFNSIICIKVRIHGEAYKITAQYFNVRSVVCKL